VAETQHILVDSQAIVNNRKIITFSQR